jgi:hypothetical protein
MSETLKSASHRATPARKTAACDSCGRDIEAINRPEKRVNALLIICRTVGCTKGRVHTIRNNAEEIRGFAKSGNKVISFFKMFVNGMYRIDVEYIGRG